MSSRLDVTVGRVARSLAGWLRATYGTDGEVAWTDEESGWVLRFRWGGRRFAYSLGVPGSALSAPFRKPAKERLLAAPVDPLIGDRVAGTAIRAGHFLLNGAKLPVSQADLAGVARMFAPMERYVHSFVWLADLEAAAPREQVAPVAERILAMWLDANPAAPSRPGKVGVWSVSAAATRLLNWLVHAPLLLSGGKDVRNRALVSISDHARWLDTETISPVM